MADIDNGKKSGEVAKASASSGVEQVSKDVVSVDNVAPIADGATDNTSTPSPWDTGSIVRQIITTKGRIDANRDNPAIGLIKPLSEDQKFTSSKDKLAPVEVPIDLESKAKTVADIELKTPLDFLKLSPAEMSKTTFGRTADILQKRAQAEKAKKEARRMQEVYLQKEAGIDATVDRYREQFKGYEGKFNAYLPNKELYRDAKTGEIDLKGWWGDFMKGVDSLEKDMAQDPILLKSLQRQYAFNNISEGLKKLAEQKKKIGGKQFDQSDALNIFGSAFDPQALGILYEDPQGLAVIKQIVETYPEFEKLLADNTDRYKAQLQHKAAMAGVGAQQESNAWQKAINALDIAKKYGQRANELGMLMKSIFTADPNTGASDYLTAQELQVWKNYNKYKNDPSLTPRQKNDKLSPLQESYDAVAKKASDVTGMLQSEIESVNTKADQLVSIANMATTQGFNKSGLTEEEAGTWAPAGGKNNEKRFTGKSGAIPVQETPQSKTEGTLSKVKDAGAKFLGKMIGGGGSSAPTKQATKQPVKTVDVNYQKAMDAIARAKKGQ